MIPDNGNIHKALNVYDFLDSLHKIVSNESGLQGIANKMAGVTLPLGGYFDIFWIFSYIVLVRLRAGMTQKGENMKTEDTQVIDLTSNFEKLKDENKEKLLLVGKKLLSIKSLVTNMKSINKIENKDFENE
jgi:hypothetical protein